MRYSRAPVSPKALGLCSKVLTVNRGIGQSGMQLVEQCRRVVEGDG